MSLASDKTKAKLHKAVEVHLAQLLADSDRDGKLHSWKIVIGSEIKEDNGGSQVVYLDDRFDLPMEPDPA